MNGIQLQKILETNPQTNQTFLGVFARDELPQINRYPSCFIINTQKRNHPGEHWLAFYIDSNKICDFFDSFGNSPKFFKLEQYIKKYSNGVVYNQKQIQSWKSQNCGFYCLLFLILRSSGYNMENFVGFFYDLSEKNDEIIEKFKNNF